jgi:hypothetical protein
MTRVVFSACATTLAAVVLCSASAAAQTAPPETGTFFEKRVDIKIDGAGPGSFEFMAAPITFESEVVTGAPYSADAVTEAVQSLPDGNRIVRQSKAQLARDGAGRTRREQGLSMLGPMVNDPSDNRQVQITDPETHTITLLDMTRQTARRMPTPSVRVMTKPAGGMAVAAGQSRTVNEPPPGAFEMPLALPPPDAFNGVNVFYTATRSEATTPVVESLGKQFMEGVEAEGTRSTFTIPAGQIGNELPLSIVSERWFSSQLKVLVMSRQSDPRFGETTYRLTNIVRGEPSPALFEVPSDFTVEEDAPAHDVIFKRTVK